MSESPPERRLATDISVQFAHLPTPEAASRVAQHIRSFWDPRMRARLLALDLDDPIVVAAADLLRAPPG